MAKVLKDQRKSLEEFIKDAYLIHGNLYDYSKANYITSKVKVDIICRKHGVFSQTPNSHLRGAGCLKCYHERKASNQRRTIDEFISKANHIHNNKYDYSKVEYKNCDSKVEIICCKHGSFFQTPYNHINVKQGCPRCNMSKGEQSIIKTLQCKGIKFIHQHKFNDCKFKKVLFFDFYLPEHNTCIEFDGKQHFKEKCFGRDKTKGEYNLKIIKERDKIKDEYCHNNNIRLIRIPYTKIDYIDDFISFSPLSVL